VFVFQAMLFASCSVSWQRDLLSSDLLRRQSSLYPKILFANLVLAAQGLLGLLTFAERR
jgi:hypothetical protein